MGRTGLVPGVAGDEPADVLGVKPVDVLLWVDPTKHLAPVDVCWHRELDKNAVDVVAAVELVDGLEQRRGGGVGVDVHVDALDADFLAVALFHRDVGLTRRVVAHQHGGESGRHARVGERVDAVGHTSSNVGRDRLAVDNLGHTHGSAWFGKRCPGSWRGSAETTLGYPPTWIT
jgi:hypothetical protein